MDMNCRLYKHTELVLNFGVENYTVLYEKILILEVPWYLPSFMNLICSIILVMN